jgi:ribosomal protein S14
MMKESRSARPCNSTGGARPALNSGLIRIVFRAIAMPRRIG